MVIYSAAASSCRDLSRRRPFFVCKSRGEKKSSYVAVHNVFLHGRNLFVGFLKALEARSSFSPTTSSTSGKWASAPWRTSTRCHRGCGCFGCVHVGLFLGLDDVLLVPDSFVAKPIAHLV